MHRLISAGFLAFLSLSVCSAPARAQYNCPVTIRVDEKVTLKATIVEVKRPPTAQLWKMLPTLLFEGPAEVDGGTLKGAIRLTIDGAGDVRLEELRVVQHTKGGKLWLIDPDEIDRVLHARDAQASTRARLREKLGEMLREKEMQKRQAEKPTEK